MIIETVHQQAAALHKAYSAFMESELIKALEHIEGKLPSDEKISARGKSYSHDLKGGGQEISYRWNDKEILRFSPPRVSEEGRLLVGVERWYLEKKH